MALASIIEHLLARARTSPDVAAYYWQVDGAWQAVEWRDYAASVTAAAVGLRALGVQPGERVAIVSDNRPEWAIVHLAALAIGGVSVGVFASQPYEYICAQLDRAGAVVVLLDRPRLLDALAAPSVRNILTVGSAFRDEAEGGDPRCRPFDDFLAEFMADSATDLAGDLAEDLDEDLAERPATIVFSAGTTGPGKGVIASHGNVLAAAEALADALDMGESDWTLSYLPLANPLEQALSIHIPVLVGALVYYAEAPEKVAGNLRAVQPSVFTATPRIWRSMHTTVAGNLDRLTGWQRRLLDRSRAVTAQAQAQAARGRRPGLGTRMRHSLARYLVIDKLRRVIGLANARVCLSTAAVLAPDTQAFFASLGVTIRELYGQVETGYAVSVARARAAVAGTVGAPLCEVRIEGDGQVSVRGPTVCLGYLGAEQADGADGASLADTDGWYRTGDLGRLDDEGYMTVLGRVGAPAPDDDTAAAGELTVENGGLTPMFTVRRRRSL